MDNLDNALFSLKEELYSLPLIKEFLKIKQEINDNERLSNLDKNIKRLQHLSCKNNDKAAKEKYLKLKEEFDNDPLIVNYQILYEEVNNLLKEIKQILE